MVGPGFDGGPGGDRIHGRPSLADSSYHSGRDLPGMAHSPPHWQNGGGLQGKAPHSPALSAGDRDRDPEGRRSGERNRSRQRTGRTGSGQLRMCKKCGEPLTGQFVRALDGTFHLDCFRCRDCGEIVASKFFPADDENGTGQYPLCETDYFRRLGLLCYQCGGALRGSYITALERKYHVEHFTCSLCPTVFGAQDSYYEHDGSVYCHYHYSTQFAQRCNGCQTAILKQFVEIYRNGQNQHWHPECYMIHKFWNVRLTPPSESENKAIPRDEASTRDLVKQDEERMEEKVYRIWSVLSTFEESSASCISDMLLHVSNGSYVEGVSTAKKFIWHVEILFRAADRLDVTIAKLDMKALSYGREAKLLCKKIVAFFSLLSKTHDASNKKLGVTQELLSLVTGLAHYLKLLIRICLQGALRIEKECNTSDGLYKFLEDLADFESFKGDDNPLHITVGMSRLSANDSDQCAHCRKPIEDECAKAGDKRWHVYCVNCSRCGKELGRSLETAHFSPYDHKIYCANCDPGPSDKSQPLEHVSKLQQYVFLLKVALARLLEILRSNGAIPRSPDEAPNGYTLTDEPPRDRPEDRDVGNLRADARSKSHGGERDPHQKRESSYENTLNDVRRLRSTRLDKHLSSSFRRARQSRIMDGPEGRSVRPGSSGADETGQGSQGFHILEDRGPHDEGTTDAMFGHENALTLDDLSRIVAVEQAKEHWSGGHKQGRQELFRSPATEPNFAGSQDRAYSVGRDGERRYGEPSPQRIARKYFSELSGLEYFIVRHIAVMMMHPLVEADFTLDDLLGLIESRKPNTFWNKFGKAFKPDGRKAAKKKGIFGVPLESIIERDGAESTDGVGPGALRIPAIIDDIISTMRQMDLSVEGVFRKNGNIKKLSELVEQIDREGCDNVDLSKQPVVQLAALLKRYLRELPDPLMTHKLYRLWLAAAKITDDDRRRLCIHLACCLLPKPHRDSLEILFCFIKWAGSFHQVDEETGSRMDVKNLATVIAPNILYTTSKAPQLDSDPMFAIAAVEVLIKYNEEMCMVPDEVCEMLSDQTLFNNSGDISTKEILKRLNDRAVNGPRPTFVDPEVVGRHDPIRPHPPRRVDTDPTAWQHESSVRPMQDPNPPYTNQPQGTPPQTWRNPDDGHPSPYNQQFGSTEAHRENVDPNQQPREWRNSGWNNNNNNNRPNGSVGVTGAI